VNEEVVADHLGDGDHLAVAEEPYLVDVGLAEEEQDDLTGLCPILRTRAGDPLLCLRTDCWRFNPESCTCGLWEELEALHRAGGG
jgi:hypothetical protein